MSAVVSTDAPLVVDGAVLRTRLTLAAGESVAFALETADPWQPQLPGRDPVEIRASLASTKRLEARLRRSVRALSWSAGRARSRWAYLGSRHRLRGLGWRLRGESRHRDRQGSRCRAQRLERCVDLLRDAPAASTPSRWKRSGDRLRRVPQVGAGHCAGRRRKRGRETGSHIGARGAQHQTLVKWP